MMGMLSPEEKKAKILSFLEKDIFIINNYESAPFKNKNHAIECLIPYHVFQAMADDVKFKGSDVDINLDKGFNALHRKVSELYEETFYLNESFTPQLLLYHEQRYINSLMKQKLQEGDEQKQEMPSTMRLARSKALPVYGKIDGMRLKYDKSRSNE